jgi:hypothetical protein
MTDMKESPWIAQFDSLIARDVIRKRAEFIPDPVPDLLTQPAHIAGACLNATLKQVILLTEPELDAVAKIVLRSHAYVVEAYPSMSHYMATLHSKEVQVSSPTPICLTGLAGTGKSIFLTALQRALPVPTEFEFDAAIVDRKISLRSNARTNVKTSRDFVEILSPWLPEEPQVVEKNSSATHEDDLQIKKPKMNLGTAVDRATRYSYRVGLHASLVDEMQFFTHDASAIATPTKFLLMMSYIGVPLIYAANFSLCHKLMKRNQEDKDRLLGDIIVLRPLELTTEGLSPLLRVYDHILGDCVQGSLCEFIPTYAAMTLGIRRKICDLTVAAYKVMRQRNDSKLSVQHFKLAYERELTKPFRDDVQCLLQMNSSCKPLVGRSDLWCPFGLNYNRFPLFPSVSEGGLAKTVTEKIILSSLTASEKKLLQGLEHARNSGSASSNAPESHAEPVKSSKGKRNHTAEELLRNTMLHQKRDHGGR